MCHYAALFLLFVASGSRLLTPTVFRILVAQAVPWVTDRFC
jgi:hypothetical protein